MFCKQVTLGDEFLQFPLESIISKIQMFSGPFLHSQFSNTPLKELDVDNINFCSSQIPVFPLPY